MDEQQHRVVKPENLSSNRGMVVSVSQTYERYIIYLMQSNTYCKAIFLLLACLRNKLVSGTNIFKARLCLYLAECYMKVSDLPRALPYAKKTLHIAKEEGNTILNISACYLLTACGFLLINYFHQHGKQYDFVKANECALEALNISLEIRDKRLEMKSRIALGVSFRMLGDFVNAIKSLEKALIISKQTKDSEEEFHTRSFLAEIYARQERHVEAIEHRQRCLSIARQNEDKEKEMSVLLSTYGTPGITGKDKKSLDCLEACIHSMGNKALQGWSFGSLSEFYFSRTDYKKSIAYAEKQLIVSQEIGNKHGEANANEILGNSYKSLGDLTKAFSYMQRNLDIRIEVGDSSNACAAYYSMIDSLAALGKYEQMITSGKKCIEIAIKAKNKQAEGTAAKALGDCYSYRGKHKEALGYWKQALTVFMEQKYMSLVATLCLSLASGYMAQNNFVQARLYALQALATTKELRSDENNLWCSYFYVGLCSVALGNLDDASLHLEACVGWVETTEHLLSGEDSMKITYGDVKNKVYQLLCWVMLCQGKEKEALTVAERGRARALADLLKSKYAVQSVPDSVITYADVQNIAVKLNRTILFYNVFGPHVFVWILQPEGNIIVKACQTGPHLEHLINLSYGEIGVRGESCEDRAFSNNSAKDVPMLHCIERQMFELFRSFSSSNKRYPEAFVRNIEELEESKEEVNNLEELYLRLVSPVVEEITTGEVIIVPHSSLNRIPFAALQNKNGQFLSELFPIRLLPSLTTGMLIAKRTSNKNVVSGKLLIVGDPDVPKFSSNGRTHSLTSLPGARKEAQMIAVLLSVEPLIGSEATKDVVLSRLNTASLIHIAAHGNAEKGEIMLAPSPTPGCHLPDKEDCLLTMAEVHSVNINQAKLVVLSCCHTGRGEIKAEGVIGIARAFIAAGACSVLASLWALSDASTLDFMCSFYQKLRDGESASLALNHSMAGMRQSGYYTRPSYWAPFVLIGDDVTLELGNHE